MKPAKVLNDLVDSAIGAKTHYEVWWAQASEGRRKYVAAMNKHSDFFNASRDAHYVAFFVYFARLFDKNSNASSINTYLRLVKPTLDPVKFKDFTARHTTLRARATPIVRVRHDQVAHVNARLSEEDVFVPLKITWNQVRDTIFDASSFVADLAGASQPGEIGIPRDERLHEATHRLILAVEKSEAPPFAQAEPCGLALACENNDDLNRFAGKA